MDYSYMLRFFMGLVSPNIKMKTLLAMLTAGALLSSPTELITEDLIGFTMYSNAIRLEWDTNGDGLEDIRVYYYWSLRQGQVFTSDPFMLQIDKNYNGEYEEDETIYKLNDD